MELRPYQSGALDAIWAWWGAGRKREPFLICAPTGAGKTVIISELCRRLVTQYEGVSILILAHRKELIEQAETRILHAWSEAPVGVYAASLGRRESAQILVASRDTIAPVIDTIGQFNFLIIDEAHRVNNTEEGRYRAIINSLKAQYEDLVVIGFTATPYRLGQGKIYGNGKLFADMAYQIKLRTLIDSGHLVDYRFAIVKPEAIINTDGIKTVGGDFDEGELAERATADGMVHAAIEDWSKHASDRQASVFFCVSILHAEMVAEEMTRRGILCPVVTGKTPMKEREEALKRFDKGDFKAIANVGVLTEGWDCPRADCIVLLRPTQSASLYVQMAGRGLRLFHGKQNCLILDYAGNVERLGKPEDAQEKESTGKKGKGGEMPDKRCGTWLDGTGEDGGKWINGCGCANHIAARQCVQCHQPFIDHDTKAYGTDALGRKLKTFDVESVTARVATSRDSGRDYVRVAYNCGLFEVFYRNVMLGYPGYAGQKAIQQWKEICHPETSEGGYEEVDLYSAVDGFNPRIPKQITVDLASKWKEIVEVKYAD